ncbi:MAG: hypothetical protein Q7R85_02395 [bacterium]|nr:hypothetical protein [bacterium]
MGVLNFMKGMFVGVGRKNLKSGTHVIVHLDGVDVLGVVVSDKDGSRRKRVRVKLASGGDPVVVRRRDVTVD